MAFGLAPVLDRHRIFGSGDAEETRAFLSTKQFQLELAPRDAGQLDARFNGVYMPGMYLGYIHYGRPLRSAPRRGTITGCNCRSPGNWRCSIPGAG